MGCESVEKSVPIKRGARSAQKAPALLAAQYRASVGGDQSHAGKVVAVSTRVPGQNRPLHHCGMGADIEIR